MGLLKNLGQVILKPIVSIGNKITDVLEPAYTKKTGKKAARTNVEEAAGTTFGKVLTAGIILSGVGAAGFAAPAATAKIALPVATVVTLAPKTTEKITSSPDLLEVAAASAINPFAGIIVAGEKGASIIGAAFEDVSPAIKAAAAGAGVIAAGAGLAAAAGVFDKEDIPTLTELPATFAGTEDQISEMTPETVDITAKKKRKAKKTSPQPFRQSIRQVVNISMHQSQNKKYIREIII